MSEEEPVAFLEQVDDEPLKIPCKKCGEMKETKFFNVCSSNKRGFRNDCKACKNIKAKESIINLGKIGQADVDEKIQEKILKRTMKKEKLEELKAEKQRRGEKRKRKTTRRQPQSYSANTPGKQRAVY